MDRDLLRDEAGSEENQQSNELQFLHDVLSLLTRWNTTAILPGPPRTTGSPGTKALHDGRVHEFLQSILGNPMGSSRIKAGNLVCCGDCPPVKNNISLTDLAEGPVDGFSDKIPIIGCPALDDLKETEEHPIFRVFVMDGQHGHEDKPCPSNKLLFARTPGNGFRGGVPGSVEQVQAHPVTDRPIVKIPGPSVHLAFRNSIWLLDKGGKNPSVMDGCFPESLRQSMIAPERSGKLGNRWSGNSKGVFRHNAVSSHAGNIALTSLRTERGHNLIDIPGDDHKRRIYGISQDIQRTSSRSSSNLSIKTSWGTPSMSLRVRAP